MTLFTRPGIRTESLPQNKANHNFLRLHRRKTNHGSGAATATARSVASAANPLWVSMLCQRPVRTSGDHAPRLAGTRERCGKPTLLAMEDQWPCRSRAATGRLGVATTSLLKACSQMNVDAISLGITSALPVLNTSVNLGD
jgi:hypothetical protein